MVFLKSVSSKSFSLIRFDYVIRRGCVKRKRGDVMEVDMHSFFHPLHLSAV